MAKQIPLTQGKFVTVDDEDYEWATQWKWQAMWDGRNWYACRSEGTKPNQKTIWLHREIMQAPDGVQVDHRDGDGLNNQRHNLRFATNAENCRNRGPTASNTSGYKGVAWHEGAGRWRAQIGVNGKPIHLGLFDDPIEAARAYDKAAKEHHRDFAWFNFPEERWHRKE